ncbi:MAG TPA: LacI family DNA-binding transcriptional regulator [Caulobacter sp.]|nr:LacI family DNA-binding transcriptional regulator [Caulobacter sp.]
MKKTDPPFAVPELRTLKDVAKVAGVSASTVSRALADNEMISPGVRERIQQIARDGGFSVNPAGRMLRTRQSHTIALILPLGHETKQHLYDPFFMAMLAYLADDVSRRQYDLLLRRVEATRHDWLRQVVESTRVDGLLVIGQSDQTNVLQDFGETYRPMVVWGQWQPDQTYLTVGADNVAGGRLAAAHLLDRGRKRLAFFGNTDVPEFEARYEGFRNTLPLGIYDQHIRVPIHLTSEDSYEAAVRFLKEHPSVDGVFAASDVVAMSVIRAAVHCGLAVPQTLSVVGFDDVPLASQCNPPLTTVRQDLERGAALMCDLLFRRIQGEDGQTSVRLPPRLIVRGSS